MQISIFDDWSLTKVCVNRRLKYLTRLCFRWWVLIDLRCNLCFVGFGSSIRSVLDDGGVIFVSCNGDCWFVVYARKSFSLWSWCFLCFRSIYDRWCLMLSSFIIVSFWLLDMFSCWGTSSFVGFKTWVRVQRARNWFGSFERSHIHFFRNLVSFPYDDLLGCGRGMSLLDFWLCDYPLGLVPIVYLSLFVSSFRVGFNVYVVFWVRSNVPNLLYFFF